MESGGDPDYRRLSRVDDYSTSRTLRCAASGKAIPEDEAVLPLVRVVGEDAALKLWDDFWDFRPSSSDHATRYDWAKFLASKLPSAYNTRARDAFTKGPSSTLFPGISLELETPSSQHSGTGAGRTTAAPSALQRGSSRSAQGYDDFSSSDGRPQRSSNGQGSSRGGGSH